MCPCAPNGFRSLMRILELPFGQHFLCIGAKQQVAGSMSAIAQAVNSVIPKA